MLLSGVSFLSLVAASAAGAIRHPLDCWNPSPEEQKTCAKSVDPVVALEDGTSYAAMLQCKDCPYTTNATLVDGEWGHNIEKQSQVFFLNLTLSANKRTLLLNDYPLHPLPTIPIPPPYYATQFPSSFSHKNLSRGLQCSNPFCLTNIEEPDCVDWCWDLPLSFAQIKFDYVYTVKTAKERPEGADKTLRYLEITFDMVGANDGYWADSQWEYNNKEQQLLWVLLGAKDVTSDKQKNRDQTADPFSGSANDDKVYEYTIVDLNLKDRPDSWAHPQPKTLSFAGKVRRFFGSDIWEEEGHRFVYLGAEWGDFGKQGTLRNIFGDFIHWDSWPLFWIILSSTIAGSAAVYGLYNLYFWLLQQRELAQWDGMDNVWDNLRRESEEEEEEDALLDGEYRDDPGEGGSQRYTDEPSTMKPLPSKPLPEKPLPDVPLIDA